MGGPEAIEVELALARDQEYLSRAVFQAPFVVSLGRSEAALLRVDDPSLPGKHDFLELTEDGVFLVLVEGMELELVTGEQRETLDTLRDAGTAVEEEGAWRVSLPLGANAVLNVGHANIMMKSRPASDPGSQVEAAGHSPALVCGRCGADLTLVLHIPHVLSPCPRCGARNRLSASGPAETDQRAGESDQGGEESDQGGEESAQSAEATDQGAGLIAPQPHSLLGPDGPEEDFSVGSLFPSPDTAATEEAGTGDSGEDKERQQEPDDFEEDATEPGVSPRDLSGKAPLEVSVGGEAIERLASAPTQLVDAEEEPAGEPATEVEASAPQPPRRRRKKKRRAGSGWTPWLVSLILVGLLSGALGLSLVFYAVVIR